MGFLCSELGFPSSAGEPEKGFCRGEGRSMPWEDRWLRSRISGPQQVWGCLREGKAEPVVGGEPGGRMGLGYPGSWRSFALLPEHSHQGATPTEC